MVPKNDPKTRNFQENFDILCRKISGKYLDLFSRNFSQIFPDLGQKNGQSLEKFTKKNSAKKKIWVGQARKTGFSFFVALIGIFCFENTHPDSSAQLCESHMLNILKSTTVGTPSWKYF